MIFDRWPAVADEHRKLQAVHRSRYLNIGEDDANFGPCFKDQDVS